ncbi:MAG TPA: thioesterase family protein [Abditibacteriaceae bacterium]|jgi:acyl-CoA thioester hydrolase
MLSITVVAFETDFGGVVSNTRYVEYIERGRYALLHAAGVKVTQAWETQGVMPVVRRLDIEYLGFARHEDELQLHVKVGQHGGATTTLHYELSRPADGAILMRAVQTLAYLNTNWKPTRVPRTFRDALSVKESSTH